MDLEIVPPLSDADRQALKLALARADVSLDDARRLYAGAWRRVAALEAVDNEPDRGTRPPHARSPRSTRGATRA